MALVLLQRTLHLPVTRRDVHIDYLGAAFLTAGVSTLLIWVTLAGDDFAWVSTESALFVGGGVLAVVAFVATELRAKEPIVPLRLFRDRTTTLAIVASVATGVAMFGSSVFLGQYLQISRGYSPTAAGLLTIPMVAGLLLSSTVSGILITRTGRWKNFLVAGSILVVVGFALLATVDHETNMVLLGVFLFVLGVGIGMTMQNLVLAVQNTVAAKDLGAASSAVAFFRSLGGTIGVSVLGAVLSARVGTLISDGVAATPGAATATAGSGSLGLADLADAPPAIQDADPDLLRRRDRPDLPGLRGGRRRRGGRDPVHPRDRAEHPQRRAAAARRDGRAGRLTTRRPASPTREAGRRRRRRGSATPGRRPG